MCTGAQQQASSAWAVLQEGRLAVPTISKSDEAFAEQGVEFVRGHEGIDLSELNGLFVKVLPYVPVCNLSYVASNIISVVKRTLYEHGYSAVGTCRQLWSFKLNTKPLKRIRSS